MMNSGWLKVWRKIDRNKSWSCGVEYRGLMITILQKAAWKTEFFMGNEIMPGQLAISINDLAKDCKLEKTKVFRMLKKLQREKFITVTNVQHRYTLITVINWGTYQEKQQSDATPVQHWCNTTCNAGATLVQRPIIIEEYKNKEKEYNMPQKCGDSISGKCPEYYHPDFELFWEAYPARNGKKNNKKGAFQKWWIVIRDGKASKEDLIKAITQLKEETETKYIPDAATWLNKCRWEDEILKTEKDESKWDF